MAFLPCLSFACLVIFVVGVWGQPYPCPAPPPCTCKSQQIGCSSLHLTSVPPFGLLPNDSTSWFVYLNDNNIRTIPADAFVNIRVLSLLLHDNQIDTIDPDAFRGSEVTMITLDLANNMLDALPPAVTNLRRLENLAIYGNPMPMVDMSLLAPASKTLQNLQFGSETMTTWPTINKLPSLRSIVVYNTHVQSVANSTFSGLESSLRSVTISNTSLEALPSSFFKLNVLNSLSLTKNTKMVIDGNLFETLPSIQLLEISDSILTNASAILNHLQNLTILNFDQDSMSELDEYIMISNFLSTFSLSNNQFQSVPKLVSRISALTYLDMSRNQITRIDDGVFYFNPRIENLFLGGNAISSMTYNAFRHCPNLQTIHLENNNLTSIPSAVGRLSKLVYLDLSNNPISCSCSNLAWTKYWHMPKSLQLIGDCANNGTLSLYKYISFDIKRCP